jgi:hypothetical protein
MSKRVMAIACAYILVLFAVAGCNREPPTITEGFDMACQHEIRAATDEQSKRAAESAYARRQEIREEIASLKDHPWAGEYFKGDGLGMNIMLSIAPKAGYVFEWHGCEGLYVRDYGTVEWKDGEIRPSHVYKKAVGNFYGIADALIPVAWGDRKYLISSDEVVDFCNDVNAGFEPRTDEYGRRYGHQEHGMSFLRLGDQEKQVVGPPIVPKDYRPYLLKEPITAAILAVGEPVKKSDRDRVKWTTAVTIDAGKKKGVLPGMQLYLIAPQNVNSLGMFDVNSLRVSRVEDDKAEAVLEQFDNGTKGPDLKVGWKVSTRAPLQTP